MSALVFELGAESKPQALIPGVAPVSQRQKLEAKAAQPLRGGTKAPGGLFDESRLAQTDMFDAVSQEAHP